ncbi:baseplate J/gp47 family protein [uncultured Ilyobacter sp.]|uniref:baseplate J/gp47 family protein n=1 Tax=uncultured Ilyobacter sp. TaxID=544433 RepID=UPI0029C995C3|nr:baseplate J/gp47 family protein [uncultured Ilyobacter sp.]
MASGLTENGFEIESYETIYANKIADFRSIYPALRDTDSNPLIPLIKYNAQKEYEANEEALSHYNNMNVYTAVGTELEKFVLWRKIIRQGEKYSTGKITVMADEGTVIPAFWSVETPDKIGFLTTNTISQTIGATGILELEVKASEAGSDGNVEIGRITEQVEVITGVSSITNSSATAGGTDVETNTELRTRYLADIDNKSLFSKSGVAQYILDNTDAEKCIVKENYSDITDAAGRPPHSYEVYAVGDTDANILQAVFDYKVLGITSHGAVTENFDDITVGITRPTIVDLYLEINVTEDGTWDTLNENTIKQAIVDHIESVDIGGTVYLYNLIGETYRNGQGIKSLTIKLDGVDPPMATTDYSLASTEIARLLISNVVINVTV